MNPLLVAAYRRDIEAHVRLAREFGFGLEIQSFSHPDVLDGDWRGLLAHYRRILADFSGPLACHGAFFDMSAASMDARVVALTRERYLHNLDIAAELGAAHVVFHTNFLPMLHTVAYRQDFIQRQADFWNAFAHEAAQREIWIALENMWDPDPWILHAVLQNLTESNVGMCLDTSHAYLYNEGFPVEQWIKVLAPYIIHSHMNNTRGLTDEHVALNVAGGAVDYTRILPLVAASPRRPWLVLELDDPEALEESLAFVAGLVEGVPAPGS